MNKYEKAIQFLQDALDTAAQWENDYRVNQIGISEINTAMEALEKQIPKKPIKTKENIRYSMCYICPNCQKNFSGTGIASYCYHCGQALDWSDTE